MMVGVASQHDGGCGKPMMVVGVASIFYEGGNSLLGQIIMSATVSSSGWCGVLYGPGDCDCMCYHFPVPMS